LGFISFIEVRLLLFSYMYLWIAVLDSVKIISHNTGNSQECFVEVRYVYLKTSSWPEVCHTKEGAGHLVKKIFTADNREAPVCLWDTHRSENILAWDSLGDKYAFDITLIPFRKWNLQRSIFKRRLRHRKTSTWSWTQLKQKLSHSPLEFNLSGETNELWDVQPRSSEERTSLGTWYRKSVSTWCGLFEANDYSLLIFHEVVKFSDINPSHFRRKLKHH